MKMKLCLFGISLVSMLLFSIPCCAELILTTQDLVDETNYKYGVKFFAKNTGSVTLNARAYVTSRENVNGDVILGVFLLDPNVDVLYGTFTASDQSKAWSVNTEVKAEADPVP